MSILGSSGRVRRLAAAVLAAVLSLPALGSPPGADTPQELVARMRAAAESGDFSEMAACLAPEDRAELVFGMVVASSMMVAFMGMGSEMAGDMAEGMAEAFSEDGEPTAEQKAEIETAKKEAAETAESLAKKHQAILDKHGLTELMESDEGPGEAEDPGAAAAKLLAGVDQVALLGDLMAFLEELGEATGEGGEHGNPMELPGEVTGYAIDGDRATAKSGDDVLDFVRVDGRWYFKPPADEH